MERYMAEFGQGYVQAAVLSENNAVQYKISIAGSCTNSTVAPYIKFQDEDFGPQVFEDGLNVFQIDTATSQIVATKHYNLTPDHDTISQAFITYIESCPAGYLFAFISKGKLNSSQTLINWFKAHGSSAIPEKWQFDKLQVSYSAFYISGRNSITAEHVLFNDGVQIEDVSTHLDVVYDTFTDIGATGYPVRTVEDDNTYYSEVGGTYRDIKRFPTDALITPMADYNISPGDMMYLKCQLTYDAALKAEGTTRMSIRFFKSPSTSPVSSINIDMPVLPPQAPPPGAWATYERYIPVPANTDGFTLISQKTANAGQGGIRNVTFGEVTRVENPQTRPAEFGVNGIRMNQMSDNNKTTDLLVLPDITAAKAGQVYSAEFRELY